MFNSLTKKEIERYKRQLQIPGFDHEKQLRLKRSRVLIAGLGGLGSSASLYLTLAGIGSLLLIDKDCIELNNLNRQPLYSSRDSGKAKVKVAKEKLSEINSEIDIEGVQEEINDKTLSSLAQNCNVLLDALDNFRARFFLNQEAVEKRIPLVHGAVEGFQGVITTVQPGKSPCLRCIYPDIRERQEVPTIGTTPGVVSTLEALEAIKLITNFGKPLLGFLLMFDGKNATFEKIKVRRNPGCQVCSNLY
jgi:adenylyltransferase/sulfurtransferase